MTGKGGGPRATRHEARVLRRASSRFTLLSIAPVWARARVDLGEKKLAELESEALELGLEGGLTCTPT